MVGCLQKNNIINKMLNQLQIKKIRNFFSQNIRQSKNVSVSPEHLRLLQTYNINPCSLHALENLWKDVEAHEETRCNCC